MFLHACCWWICWNCRQRTVRRETTYWSRCWSHRRNRRCWAGLCWHVSANNVRQFSSFTDSYFVIIIQGGFPSMSCDLNNLVTRLTSILKLSNDDFSRWVICDLLIGFGRQTAGYRLHCLPNSVLSHSCFRVPSITCWSGDYRQVQRTGFLQHIRSVLQPLFKQFNGISLASVRRPHLLRRAACWIS